MSLSITGSWKLHFCNKLPASCNLIKGDTLGEILFKTLSSALHNEYFNSFNVLLPKILHKNKPSGNH